MKKTLVTMASALVLTMAVAAPASARDGFYVALRGGNTDYNMNDKDIFNIKELIKFLEDNHTKENGYKFQIRVIVNKTLNGKFKVINLTQDGFDKVSNALYSLIQKDIEDDLEDLASLDLTKNRL